MNAVVVVNASGGPHPEWTLTEETLPESPFHDEAVGLLRAILAYWARARPSVQVARNIGVRWSEEEPTIGLDPDVCILDPALPPGAPSVCTWKPGHFVPKLAIEIVSELVSEIPTPKNYEVVPAKYLASGTPELWIFDPHLVGPKSVGPHLLQVWRRSDAGDALVRIYAGDGPAYSPYLDAHIVIVNRQLRIAADPEGQSLWPTGEEAARAEREAEMRAATARMAELDAPIRDLEP